MDYKIGNSNPNDQLGRRFKKIGHAVIIIGAIVLTIARLTGLNRYFSGIDRGQTAKVIISMVLVISLLLVTWAKERKEDELSSLVRLKSIRTAFYVGIIYIVITPLIGIIWGKELLAPFSSEMAIGILLLYHIVFLIQKRRLS